MAARIFSLCDAYDAMTSDRPYRRAKSHEEAVAEIFASSGKQFDPKVVDAFLSIPKEEWLKLKHFGQQSKSSVWEILAG